MDVTFTLEAVLAIIFYLSWIIWGLDQTIVSVVDSWSFYTRQLWVDCWGTAKECSVPSPFTWVLLLAIAEQVEFCREVTERQLLEATESWKNFKWVSFLEFVMSGFISFEHFISLEHSSDTCLHSMLQISPRRGHLAPVDGDNICKKFKFERIWKSTFFEASDVGYSFP